MCPVVKFIKMGKLNMFIPAVFYFLSSNKRLYPLKLKQNGSGKEYRISGKKRDKKDWFTKIWNARFAL